MDLSKAYAFIPYALRIAKLEYEKYGLEYGLDKTTLYLLRDYLINWK